MAKNSKLAQTAVKIGAAMGKADRTDHKVAKAGVVAKKEVAAISKRVKALKRQLQKNTEGQPCELTEKLPFSNNFIPSCYGNRVLDSF